MHKPPPRGLFVLGLLFMVPAAAQSGDGTILYVHRDPAARALGTAVLGLSDLNGDGHADYAIGAPGFTGSGNRIQAISGRNGTPLWTKTNTVSGTGFGSILRRAPDYDLDGHADIFVGEPDHNSGTGRMQIVSAKTGTTLTTLTGTATGDGFGINAVDIGDMNKDGKSDLLVTSINYPTGNAWGRVETISGANFTTVLATQYGSGMGSRFGAALAACGDVDSDTYPDYLISEPGANANAGIVRQYSGRFRSVLKSVNDPSENWRFGEAIMPVGDTNGDGEADVIIGQLKDTSWNGRVHAYTQKTMAPLFVIYGGGYGAWGLITVPVGDLDADGGADFALAMPGLKNTYGQVSVFSGKTQAEIRTIKGWEYPGGLGSGLGACDLDADGKQDLIIGQPGSVSMGSPVGQAVWAMSLQKLPLSTPTGHTVSLKNGGLVTYVLDAGPTKAGQTYLLTGSMSGWKPGFPLWGHQIPLNIDMYFTTVTGNVNSPILPNSFGTLDANGRASCTFQVIPGLPAQFIGTVIDHAAIVVCPNFACMHLATNARPVTLVD